MKKWHFRTILILCLGGIGFFVLAMRPALIPDESLTIGHKTLCMPLDANRESSAHFAHTYTWNLQACPTNTLLDGDRDPSALDLLDTPRWVITFAAEDGELRVHAEAPLLASRDKTSFVSTSTSCRYLQSYPMRTADGSIHLKRIVQLHCKVRVVPSFWQQERSSSLRLVLMLDLVDGTVDVVNPLNYVSTRTGKIIRTATVSGLPERYNGSHCRQQLLYMHDLLCSVTTPDSANKVARFLRANGPALMEQFEDPQLDWPTNWKEDAETARQIHDSIIPTLLYLQEHACFGSQELIDFINSSVFGRIFGESFVDEAETDISAAPRSLTHQSQPAPDAATPNENHITKPTIEAPTGALIAEPAAP